MTDPTIVKVIWQVREMTRAIDFWTVLSVVAQYDIVAQRGVDKTTSNALVYNDRKISADDPFRSFFTSGNYARIILVSYKNKTYYYFQSGTFHNYLSEYKA